jgi:hypothetical protein
VGPSNIITLLNSIPPYWAVLKATFNERVGDPSKPEDAERLKRQSPLFSAKNITAPLLVVQGANDPRVKKAESDQIVVALRDLGRDVEYIVAPDEGHGFAGADNRMALSVAIEKFLSKHLGGRYQQDVPEKLEKRLEAITVDVKTVSLAPPPKSAAEAEKAPLPAANGSLLKPLSLVYKGTGMMGSKPISLDVTRTIAKGAVSGAPTWQIVTNQSSGQGGAVDTFDVDASTLIPLRWSVKQGLATVVINYSAAGVKGAVKMGTQEMPIDVALDAPVFGDGSSLEVLVGALPLAPAYQTTLRVFDFQTQKGRSMSLAVAGSESVTVPAGTFACYKLEIKPIDDESGGSTIFVNKTDPRVMIRGVFELPPQAGGGEITTDLTSVK